MAFLFTPLTIALILGTLLVIYAVFMYVLIWMAGKNAAVTAPSSTSATDEGQERALPSTTLHQ